MKKAVVLALFCLLTWVVVPVAAHEKYRILGVIAKISSSQIDVKQAKDGKIVEIDLDGKTKVTRDSKSVLMTQVKPGSNVVVDAFGDSILDLVATEIRLVATLPTK
jgi:hypothetical protein